MRERLPLRPAGGGRPRGERQYILKRSGPNRAGQAAHRIFQAAGLLCQRPGLGHASEDLSDEAVLFWSGSSQSLEEHRTFSKAVQISLQ